MSQNLTQRFQGLASVSADAVDEQPAPLQGRIYLAGPISGLLKAGEPLESIRLRFNTYAEALRTAGWAVVNPFDQHVAGVSWSDALRADILGLVGCDAIYLMRGWKESRGARLEAMIALELG